MKNDWISVDDRLPSRDDEYLITHDLYGDPRVSIEHFDIKHQEWESVRGEVPTHWMEFPSPAKSPLH